MKTPILDAIENLANQASMCGIQAGEIVIHSPGLYDRMLVEVGYISDGALYFEREAGFKVGKYFGIRVVGGAAE